MLLTITYNGTNASDLGFLLHKNPSRPQTVKLNYGNAHVFYPEANENTCTAALLLDLNPIDLARGKNGKESEGLLFDYVNDRPYVASSFLSTAISHVYGTAMTGRCDKLPEMASAKLPLTASITMLPCYSGSETIKKLFEPLGYKVQTEGFKLDNAFQQWGESRYYNITISGEVKLSELLTHIYVLIPVLDNVKHYWIGQDEIEKLLRHGEGWLSDHPMKEYITSRYLRKKPYVNEALLKLTETETNDEFEDPEDTFDLNNVFERKTTLNQVRLERVVDVLKKSGAKRIIDLGCGEGNLLRLLLKENDFTEIAGMDVSFSVLDRANKRLQINRMNEKQKERIKLIQGSLIYKDKRIKGYDACTVIEVIEHLDLSRLQTFEKVLFGYTAPPLIVLTTPNSEYNENYKNIGENKLRHNDHRFEWTRKEFREWANRISLEYGYSVQFSDLGDIDQKFGSPTQMGVFTK